MGLILPLISQAQKSGPCFQRHWCPFTLPVCCKDADSARKCTNRSFLPWELHASICLVGSTLLPLMLWPRPPARCMFCLHVSWLPNKSRNHPVPNKFQCYRPIIPATPQSSTDKHLARYLEAVFCCSLWKMLLAWVELFLIYSIS